MPHWALRKGVHELERSSAKAGQTFGTMGYFSCEPLHHAAESRRQGSCRATLTLARRLSRGEEQSYSDTSPSLEIVGLDAKSALMRFGLLDPPDGLLGALHRSSLLSGQAAIAAGVAGDGSAA